MGGQILFMNFFLRVCKYFYYPLKVILRIKLNLNFSLPIFIPSDYNFSSQVRYKIEQSQATSRATPSDTVI